MRVFLASSFLQVSVCLEFQTSLVVSLVSVVGTSVLVSVVSASVAS
jgi:hypothetical protein